MMKKLAPGPWKMTILMMVWTCCLLVSAVEAQQEPLARDMLPTTRDLAAALSDPASRTDALLTVIVLSGVLNRSLAISAEQLAADEARFRDDRAWIDRLAARYTRLPARSTLVDPAAWFIQQELSQQSIAPPLRVSPLGPDYPDLSAQLFDRTDERLAAAFLPEVLFQVELIAPFVWQQLLAQSETNPILLSLLTGLNADWFDPWKAAEPPAPVGSNDTAEVLQYALQNLTAMMGSIILPQAPDVLRVKRLRFDLLTAIPQMDPAQAATAAHILRLTTAIDGLHDHQFLEFIQTLLWVVTDLLDVYAHDSNAWSPLPRILTDFLPQLSNALARSFAEVDSRFNANLATTFDVVQELQNGSLTTSSLNRLKEELADAVMQLVLLVPRIEFYFDQPVRNRISDEIDICISVAATRDENDKPMLSRKQFDACIESMAKLADAMVRRAELAGDPGGPFAAEQLNRELEMAPWQRINYTLGYLHQRSPLNCSMPQRRLANPLEWSALATLLVWFADLSPVYFQTPRNEELINDTRQKGLEMVQIMSQQVDCISGASGSLNDMISVSLQQYRRALFNLVGGVRAAELEFREARLRPGADLVLGNDVTQETAYRTSGLQISPCDPDNVCEMTGQLEATRALVGQFPDEYLLADQTGLGSVEICYDNMQWIDRRAERVRLEDPNVADYYGYLSFDIVGRYRENEQLTEIFGSNFVSPEEYHYLIAANSPELLADGCPTEWIGTTIVTPRVQTEDGIQIVPNRLTYLAAARSRPSELINANWSKGAEWRDWFVTGIGVTDLEFNPESSVRDKLGQHLQALYQAQQQSIYSNLLREPVRNTTGAATTLFDLMREVSMYKILLRHQMILFYPQLLLDSEEVRAAFEGQSGLLDGPMLRRFQENNIAVGQIHDTGLARLQNFQSVWQNQPETVIRSGTVSVSVAHAVARLNALHRQYFSAAPPIVIPLEPVPVILPDEVPESEALE